ncbi:nucleotide sugar dehydrogenase [Shumkonia mesophila]|uniref:nucleotide sugar dehydrogenase n=1 Tax=Shumkonia mesophila TaxID=2838854 RepID=UPI00293490DF|nr:nucleotide sugar dehydrogenase [Shumkonia mesophila]
MTKPRIAVIGLGYVGIPLAVALARHFPVVGYDIKSRRVAELKGGIDRTGEVDSPVLRASSLMLTDRAADMAGCDVLIVTVPTPVDADNRPDLGAVRSACETVGSVLGQGAIVVLESTVYPGVTEEICGPILEKASGLKCGRDFFLGYSPERVNPGDRTHTVERITKVVSGQTPDVTERLAAVYGAITEGGVFRARDIRTAEAAKVIENAQRDINIAFINEVTQIFQKAGLSVFDVLAAANTKWNFLDFKPGLVGGHCIGIDPFYLARWAQDLGHNPEIILAGRRLNDGMGDFVAERIDERLAKLFPNGKAGEILILGLTFKEDVPDLRNSRIVDIVRGLTGRGHTVRVHDPMADPEEAREYYGLDLLTSLDGVKDCACVVGAVRHRAYLAYTPDVLGRLVRPGGLVADVKGLWRDLPMPQGLHRWQL